MKTRNRLMRNASLLIFMVSLLSQSSICLGQAENLDQVIHGTFFGGSRIDRIRDVTLDSHGNIIVVGGTFSEDFPVHNAYQETYGGGELPPNEYLRFSGDGFVAKFTPDYDLIWSTYIGGTGFETAIHVEVNSNDDILVVHARAFI